MRPMLNVLCTLSLFCAMLAASAFAETVAHLPSELKGELARCVITRSSFKQKWSDASVSPRNGALPDHVRAEPETRHEDDI
jgi:hypothetical protein